MAILRMRSTWRLVDSSRCSSLRLIQHSGWMCWPHRWQASSHSFGGVLKKLCWAQSPVGVSLLAMAVGQSISMLPGRTLSRAGSLLQGVVVRAQKRVGAGLPAMAVGQSTWCWMCWPHRWRASSHNFGGVLKNLCWAQNPVGVSLLAMAVVHSILMLPGRTLSRAGSLLQGDGGVSRGHKTESRQSAANSRRSRTDARSRASGGNACRRQKR